MRIVLSTHPFGMILMEMALVLMRPYHPEVVPNQKDIPT